MTVFEKNIAVVGCGYWGKNLVRNFCELGVLRAVFDYNQKTSESFAEQYSVSALSFDEILNAKDIIALVIAAPAKQHFELTKQALEHGKHVFVEKPLALSVEDGKALCALAKKKNLILMVGHLLHYHSAYQKLKSMVNAGDLGELRYIYSHRLNLGKVRREEDILWSFAPHDISVILDLMEEEPRYVEAHGGFYLSETIADTTTMHLTFSGNKKAHVFVSWLHPFKEQKLVVIGAKAMAVFVDGEPWERKLKLYKHSIEIENQNSVPLINKADVEYIELEESEPLKSECSHFLDSIYHNKKPITDADEGLRVLKVLEASTQAIKLRSNE